MKVSVNCSTEELTITWSSSSPAEEYSAIISGGTGQPLYCNSTDSHCTLRELRCGSRYNVTVSSFNGSCLSPPSSEVTALTCEVSFNFKVYAALLHLPAHMLFLFSTMSSHQRLSHAHLCSRSCSCVMGRHWNKRQTVYGCGCEPQRSQV